MNFSIKRDYLPVVILNILLVLFLVLFLCLTFCGDGWSTRWGFSFFVLGTFIALILYDTSVIFTTCRLDLENHTLTYVAGVFKYSIDTRDIVDVRKSINIYQSIAPSYDRVRIVTSRNKKQNVYYISVTDNNQLVSLLKREMKVNEEAELARMEVEKKEERARKRAEKKAELVAKEKTRKKVEMLAKEPTEKKVAKRGRPKKVKVVRKTKTVEKTKQK